MKTFLQINDVRIIKSSVKKYMPNGDKSINIYYTPSRNRIDVESFVFLSKGERDEMIEILDTIFL